MIYLDDLDRRLVAALREDGRAPILKLASILGVSRATVQKRLNDLRQSGAILGFTLRAQGDDDGSIRAVMLIEVTGRSTGAVVKRLHGFPELAALHTTNGSWDLIAELRASTLQDFDRVLREVRNIDGVLNSETSIMLGAV